jgi:hypothetical protein
MNLGMGIFLNSGRIGSSGVVLPSLVGGAGNGTGNPTLPAHQANDLIIDVTSSGSSTTPPAPTAASAFESEAILWDNQSHGTNSAAISAYYRVASASGRTTNWTGANGQRYSWVFRNAAIDQIAITEGTGTTLDFPELVGMAANSLVGVYVMARVAQTNTAAVAVGLLAGGFTQRVNKLTSSAAWVGDTNVTHLSSFNPANQTFDTGTNGWFALAFSVKSA